MKRKTTKKLRDFPAFDELMSLFTDYSPKKRNKLTRKYPKTMAELKARHDAEMEELRKKIREDMQNCCEPISNNQTL